jgi:2-keto-myo-inositol isomerase
MSNEHISRRNLLKSGLAASAGLGLESNITDDTPKKKPVKSNFRYCLNTSTIMKQEVGLMAEIELTAKAGYQGIEIWMQTLDAYLKKGGSLSDIKKKTEDLGLVIENAIGFANWMVDDPTQRKEALEQTKREMNMLAQIGCKRIAAPPFGATKGIVALEESAIRYKEVCVLGREMGVQPQLELWGFSSNLHLMGQVLFVAAECSDKAPAILADVYHLYKGGSELNSLNIVGGSQIQIFHMNDYPAEPNRQQINDSHRVMPGDGIAPMNDILQKLNTKNSPIVLSLELFSEKYWQMDAKEVAKIGLEKMKACVAKALA